MGKGGFSVAADRVLGRACVRGAGVVTVHPLSALLFFYQTNVLPCGIRIDALYSNSPKIDAILYC